MNHGTRGALLSAVVGAGVLGVTASAVGADVIYVDDDAPFNGDGASWDTAYRLLQDALARAAGLDGGVEIRIAQGTYRPDQGGASIPNDRTATFELRDGMRWSGGYAGLGAPDPDHRDPATYETILSGELGDPAVTADNAHHVVVADGVSVRTAVDGLTFAYGSTEFGDAENVSGAGLLAIESDLWITNCVARANRAHVIRPWEGGGGLAVLGGAPRIVDCSFIENATTENGAGAFSSGHALFLRCQFDANGPVFSHSSFGAGLFIQAGDNRVVDCTFTGNEAQRGAGLFVQSGHTEVSGCSFVANEAFAGGAIFGEDDANLALVDCSFFDNAATASTDRGGAVYSDGELLVAHCWFEANTARGGGALHLARDATIIGSTFVSNGTSDYGGSAILVFGPGPIVVADSVFTGNITSGDGGAINTIGDLTVAGCTLAHNSAGDGGGIMAVDGDVEIVNSILWMNGGTAQADQVKRVSPATLSVDFSCIHGLDGSLGGDGNIGANPFFIDADGADNIPGTADDDLRPNSFSPCIDAGRNAAVRSCALDHDGNQRRFDSPTTRDTGEGTAPIVDLGAYESGAPAGADCDRNRRDDVCDLLAGAVPDCNGNGVPDGCDVALGRSADCALDGVPDECQLEGNDCNENGVPDVCDLRDGMSADCNGNGVPDECDIDDGAADCNGNGVLDGCESDCNANGIPDECDILGGSSSDDDGNGIPDECQAIRNETTGDYFVSIDQAIDAAAAGHEIVVAPGTFTGPIDFDGKAIELRSSHGPELTIIDGEGTGPVVRFESGEGPVTLITGFTIRGGIAGDGGGMRIVESHPTIHNCIFTENVADPELGSGLGGGLFVNDDSDPLVLSCRFAGNTANFGGGLAIRDSSFPRVIDCQFVGNTASNANESGGRGGGLSISSDSAVRIERCHFELNVSSSVSAVSSRVGGGGVYCSTSSVYMCDTTFVGNSTNRHGGAILIDDGVVEIERSRFVGNTAEYDGGAFAFSFVERSRLVNCLIAENEAGDEGGGMQIQFESFPVLTNCTIAHNVAPSGAGLHAWGGAPRLLNSIVWGHDGPAVQTLGGGPDPLIFSSIIEGGAAGDGVMDLDPLFVDPAQGDYRLAPGSPAIDAGDPNDAVPADDFDLDGALRRQSCLIDLGAFEASATGIDCDGNGISDGCDLFGGVPDRDDDGVPDACQIASGASRDCNGNGLPEAFELGGIATYDSGYLSPFFDEDDVYELVIADPPVATATVIIDLVSQSGGGGSGNIVLASLNGVIVALVLDQNQNCNDAPQTDQVILESAIFNAIVAGGDATFEFRRIGPGSPATCPNTFLSAIVRIPFGSDVLDCNQNGVADTCDIADGTVPDLNANGVPDDCEDDCNGNGLPDFIDLLFELSLDCNENEVPDECDLDIGRSRDCDGNGVPDECDVAGGAPDCNGNLIPDACDIVDGTSQDFNANGLPDECEADCNANGLPDFLDLLFGASDDCNGNGVPDECDVADGAPDCNDNLIPDACETLMTPILASSGELSPIGAGSPQSFVLVAPPPSPEPVTFEFAALGDLQYSWRWIELYFNGVYHSALFEYYNGSCSGSAVESTLVLPAAEFNELIGESGDLVIDLVPSPDVDAAACNGESFISVTVTYTLNGPGDVNGNGVPDDCECIADIDASGAVDFADLLLLLAAWGDCASCAEDIDHDTVVAFGDLVILLSEWGGCVGP